MKFLINTGALARWFRVLETPQLFQQFLVASDKPLKRLRLLAPAPHRSEAAVLMRRCRIYQVALAFAGLVITAPTFAQISNSVPDELGWPTPTRENRPWTRWWWLGSAVDKTNLTRLLTEYRAAGLGGVEICPIYGAKGYEDRFIDFLSPKWMDTLAYTMTEAKRLGLCVDMTTGTGWPFGGPNVAAQIASAKVILQRYEVRSGQQIETNLPRGQMQCLMAISDRNERLDLTTNVMGQHLSWTAPPRSRRREEADDTEGPWRLYAVLQNGPAQKVKRAAPGGEGNVLDPYSVSALNQYLAPFDDAFKSYHGEMPRSQFHDSFEYYGAQWTPDFFKEFEARRGYDLRTQLPALFGEGPEDTVARVKCDYRETISDLHLTYIERWTEWCHAHGMLSRDQAHGSPGNLVDIYAAADIPETEIFGSVEEIHIPMNKFSSSAAHVAGHPFASSESFTWLTEHFQASLSEVKQAADYLFLSGVNHIFFHGIPYSPADAPWPGWQFYAAVNFGPQGGLWRDLPEFNAYVTRCQSILQSGSPDNDILLYYPIYDAWHSTGDLIRQNPIPKSFTNTVMYLWDHGYAFDYVSDRFLSKATYTNNAISLGGNNYWAIVVPRCDLMPETTLGHLLELARQGASVLFQDHLPTNAPGWANLNHRQTSFKQLIASIHLENTPPLQSASVGKGRFLVSTNLDSMLQLCGVKAEPCVLSGLRFVRRQSPDGLNYFLANRSARPFDGWVRPRDSFTSAVILDPRFPSKAGIARLNPGQSSRPPTSISADSAFYLQLQPGESCIVRVFSKKVVTGLGWPYEQRPGPSHEPTGSWKVKFIEGGPELPHDLELPKLISWTEIGDTEAKRFAGTALYTLEFEAPAGDFHDWVLDLGKVCESARVRINGKPVGAFWCAPFRAAIGDSLHPGKNTLEVEVTNLAANRIADLDRRKVKWKYFYDINVASKRYRSFDASDWPLRDSGLLGPVTLSHGLVNR